jgi:hypothetical protein
MAELAKQQYGVVAMSQLRRSGFPASTVSDAVRRGRLHPLHRGVYAVGHTRLTWEGHCMAAVLARPGAVASHKTAAWIWGLRRWRPETFHLTAPTRQRAKREFVVHFGRLRPEDRAVVEGIPVTSVARTMLDLAPGESTRQLHRMMERAEDRRTFDLRRFDRLLARAGGHPGRVKLRHALDTFKPEHAVLRSGLEKRFLRLALAAPAGATVSVHASLEGPARFAPRRTLAHDSRAGVGGDPERTSRCCERRVTPDTRHAARTTAAHLERRRRAGGARRSVA